MSLYSNADLSINEFSSWMYAAEGQVSLPFMGSSRTRQTQIALS